MKSKIKNKHGNGNTLTKSLSTPIITINEVLTEPQVADEQVSTLYSLSVFLIYLLKKKREPILFLGGQSKQNERLSSCGTTYSDYGHYGTFKNNNDRD